MDKPKAIYFAPLQGFTDYVYRDAHARYFGGVEEYFTPFVRLDGGEVRNKDIFDLAKSRRGGASITVPQIIANGGEEADALIRLVAKEGFDCCDINFGCPYPQQTSKFRGAGILAHADKILEVMKSVAACPELKFSVKMRLGNADKNEVLSIIDIINDAPLSYVTIHPRIGRQMYSGDLDMEMFAEVKSRLRHPVVFNGDIRTAGQIVDVVNNYGDLQAVMIGRGLLANPFLAESYAKGADVFERDRYMAFLETLMQGYLAQYDNSEYMALDKVKTFWDYPLPGVDKKRVKSIQKSRSLAEFMSLVAVAVNSIRA